LTDGAATLRVATLNVRAAIGPGPFPDAWWRRIDDPRLTRIGQAIRALDADVVALQEVALLSVDGRVVDNPGVLAAVTGYEMRFGATRHFEILEDDRRVGAGLFGNALLTRLPIQSARTYGLPQAPLDAYVEPPGWGVEFAGVRYADASETIREPRCILLCELELPGGDVVTAGSTHLSHIGSAERRLQAEAIARIFAGVADPALLAGDLNATIESVELVPLREVLTDAFELVGVPPGDPARQTSDDGWSIDHLLVRGVRVDACRVAHEVGDLSDHWPVVADVVAGAPAGALTTGSGHSGANAPSSTRPAT
jgi:endonuclease/exonuclease/phosphatase family metal-dependent hydrolase